MKNNVLRIIGLLLLLVSISSCFQGRWANYRSRNHYVHRAHYRRMHEHRNRDW